MHSASGSIVDALRQGIGYEAQAPLYFGLLAAWRLAGASLFHARLLSVALSLVTLAFTYQFAKRYIVAVAPGIVVAVVAFNPFLVWATIEARPYAAAVTFSTALLYAFFRGWLDRTPNWTARAAFVGIAVAGAYTQYYVVTLVAAAGVAVVFSNRLRALPSYVAGAALVGLALVPLLFVLPGQLGAYSALAAISPLPPYSIVLALCEFLYPHHWLGSWIHQPTQTAFYFCAAALPLGMLFVWMQRISRTSFLLLVTMFTLAALFAAFIALHVHVVFPRQTAVLFAPTVFAAFALAADIRADRRRIAVAAFCTIYAALVILSLWSDYHRMAKPGDWARVGGYLVDHVGPHDAVAVFDPEVALPLHYYYSGPLTAVPRALAFDRFDEETFTIRSDRELAASLGAASRPGQRIWLVVNDLCTTLPQFYGCDRLDRYVALHFQKLSVAWFNGSSVTQLRASGARYAVLHIGR